MKVPLSRVLDSADVSWDFGNNKLLCPVCGDGYSHAGTYHTVKSGREGYEAGWGGRGDLIVLPFEGECGHGFKVCIGFHKGENFCFVEFEGEPRGPRPMKGE